MSIIFALLKEGGASVTKMEMQGLASATERYATGVASLYTDSRVGLGVQPYFSHERSAMDGLVVRDAQGNVLTFDGRLDNYTELAQTLGLNRFEVSDSQLVLRAFLHWGEACFSHFVGDWALVLWSETEQALYLARDHAGTRNLYFQQRKNQLLCSTHLDTFLLGGSEARLAEEYVACYLASRAIRDLTPYQGVRSVPPAHYLVIRNGSTSRRSHWSETVTDTIRYKSDAQYEAHFRALFRQSVERRTGPGAPILAQLSGGVDSTAIVCMSDHIRRSSDESVEILDTVSFYDDSEASLNERAYFSITEAKRGKVGTHIDTAFSRRTFEPHNAANGNYLLPGADSFLFEQERSVCEGIWRNGYRSILSGIGGDEVLGGIPTPFPELADYLVKGNLPKLMRQSIAWSLVDRSPLIGTLYGTARYALGLYAPAKPSDRVVPPWISGRLRTKSRESYAEDYNMRYGLAPHRIENGLAWRSIIENLPHVFPHILSRPEYRYPFLDKDLVNYLFSIPPEQILRPGRRRSLMRRALVNIVPHEILERRQKAFQLRAPLRAFDRSLVALERTFADSAVASLGFVDPEKLLAWLRLTAQGDSTWWQALLRTIALELWLQSSLHGTKPLFGTMENGRHLLSLTA